MPTPHSNSKSNPKSKVNPNLSLRVLVSIVIGGLTWIALYYLLHDILPASLFGQPPHPILAQAFTVLADILKTFSFWVSLIFALIASSIVFKFYSVKSTCHMCRKKLTIRESQYCLQHGLVSTCYSCQRRWPIG